MNLILFSDSFSCDRYNLVFDNIFNALCKVHNELSSLIWCRANL